MSQKLLIHLRDAAAAAHRSSHLAISHRGPSTLSSHTRPASASASLASGSPFSDSPFSTGSKTRSTSGVDGDGDVLAWSGTSLTDLVGNLSDVELDVQVEMRRTEECAAAAAAEVPRVVWIGSAGTNEKEGSLR